MKLHSFFIFIFKIVSISFIVTVLHKELVCLRILQPFGGVDELSSVRSKYKLGFAKLVQAAVDVVCGNLVYVIASHFFQS